MKSPALLILSAALFGWAVPLSAQTTAPAAKRSGMESRLARALKMFPEADADKNGSLSMDEALAYLAAHPELKELLQPKTGSSGGSSKPASFAPGEKGTRVFVCAHSYMIYTATMLPEVAKAAGVPHLDAGRQMIGGSSVIQHWNLPDERNEAKKALREGIVDVLTVAPNLIIPDDGITNYARLGLEKNPNLRILVQSSWVPRDGKTGEFTNDLRDAVTVDEVRAMRSVHHNGWLKQLEAQVQGLNASLGKKAVFIVPVSEAVYTLRERVAEGKAPGLTKQSQMFRDDHGHPAPAMALLVTYCHFAAIHQRSPVGLPVPAALRGMAQPEELNALLQKIAWDAVSKYELSGIQQEPPVKAAESE